MKQAARLFAAFDEHVPKTIAAYFNPNEPRRETAVDKFLMDFQPHFFIKGGDGLDLGCISHWNKGRVKLVEGQRLKRDFNVYNTLLDKQEKIIAKNVQEKVYLIGNHEQWLDDLVEKDPQANEGFVELDTNLRLRERGFEIVPRRALYTVGKLNFLHGDYKDGMPPAFHAKAIAQLYKRNVIYGHYHTEMSFTETSPIDTRPVFAQCVGTMSHVNPEWRKNAPTAWTNSFFVAYLHEDGSFTSYVIRIVNGKFTFGGVTYQ